MARRADVYLFVCATVANAASFVLPISNPANLVLYASRTPPLPTWLAHFALPSLLSVLATYAVLRVTQRASLAGPISTGIERRRSRAAAVSPRRASA